MTMHRRERGGGAQARRKIEDEDDPYSSPDTCPQYPQVPAPLVVQDNTPDTIIQVMVTHFRRVFAPAAAFSMEEWTEAMQDIRPQLVEITRDFTDDSFDDEEE